MCAPSSIGAQSTPPRRAASVGRLALSASTSFFLAFLFGWLVVACGGGAAPPAALKPATAKPPQQPASMQTARDDGQWLMPAKDYASTRYSQLTDIRRDNVGSLKLAWTFSTGVLKGHEAAPLVVNNTMYIVTPYPNIVYALDLAKPGAPAKWTFKPQPLAAAQGVACCDVVNRGAAYSNGRIYFNTLDGQTIALSADTGQQVWRTTVYDIHKGESITMAPLVAKDKVLVGNSGGEFGVRGCLTALDATTGAVAWRAYTAGPDKDVLIGSRFKPLYKQDQGKDLGVATWPPDAWKIGGGTVWGWISYDPATNLIFYGTGNPGPWNADQRPGDNKWTTSLFARDLDTGEAVWAYQMDPHDVYDHDGINEILLLDLTINGQPRKVLVHPDRNAFMYVMDRQTGELLSAKPYAYTNTSKGIDMKTGRLIPVEEKKPVQGKVVREICPPEPGAKDWQPSAYSPHTGLLYIPYQNLCEDIEGVEANYIEGTPYVGANVRMYAGPGGNRGFFTAWNPVEGGAVWTAKEDLPVWSGALVTAGDVVFYGTMDGWFKALDAQSGKLLWQFKCGSGIVGQPMTYRGADGRQYVAVLSGVGGWPGGIVVSDLDPGDSSAALGFVNAMQDLPQRTTKGGMLYVFALP